MDAKKLFFLITLALMVPRAFALEVDERLTLRVLKTSDSRKTVLINRGTEDGLVEGDHARFFVSAGIVGRAMCIKVSPARSVWSVYRLVNAELLVQDAVMNLKISPPVKLSQDDSRMVVQDDVPVQVSNANESGNVGIPLAEGANDLAEMNAAMGSSQADLNSLNDSGPGHLKDKNWELWGALHVSSLSAKTEASNPAAGNYSGGSVQTQLTFAAEYYTSDDRSWWARFSPFGFVNVHRQGMSAFQGSKQDEAGTEFGGGINWHPWARPFVINEFIPFFTGSMAMGSITGTYEPGVENAGGPAQEAKGTTMSTSFGVGFKFFTQRGWGARAVLDYYMRNDDMKDAVSNLTWTRTVAGPRLWVGLSYRF